MDEKTKEALEKFEAEQIELIQRTAKLGFDLTTVAARFPNGDLGEELNDLRQAYGKLGHKISEFSVMMNLHFTRNKKINQDRI